MIRFENFTGTVNGIQVIGSFELRGDSGDRTNVSVSESTVSQRGRYGLKLWWPSEGPNKKLYKSISEFAKSQGSKTSSGVRAGLTRGRYKGFPIALERTLTK